MVRTDLVSDNRHFDHESETRLTIRMALIVDFTLSLALWWLIWFNEGPG
jgi:hypothetical protein